MRDDKPSKPTRCRFFAACGNTGALRRWHTHLKRWVKVCTRCASTNPHLVVKRTAAEQAAGPPDGMVVDLHVLHLVRVTARLPFSCPSCGAGLGAHEAIQEEAWGLAWSLAHVEDEGAVLEEDTSHDRFTAEGAIAYRCNNCNAVLAEAPIVDPPAPDGDESKPPPARGSTTEAAQRFTRQVLRVLLADRIPAAPVGSQTLEVSAGDHVHTITIVTRKLGGGTP